MVGNSFSRPDLSRLRTDGVLSPFVVHMARELGVLEPTRTYHQRRILELCVGMGITWAQLYRHQLEDYLLVRGGKVGVHWYGERTFAWAQWCFSCRWLVEGFDFGELPPIVDESGDDLLSLF